MDINTFYLNLNKAPLKKLGHKNRNLVKDSLKIKNAKRHMERWKNRPTYYVCSYGGSGSHMLCNYLHKVGHTEHIHSRKPPVKLTGVGNFKMSGYGDYPRHPNGEYNNKEWFDTTKPLSEDEVNKVKVIYIYRNPIRAIYSRYHPQNKSGLMNIEVPDSTVSLEDIIREKKDLMGLEEFFDNYTTPDPQRNYKIYCIKYEEFFTNYAQVNKALGVRTIGDPPKNTERNFKKPYNDLRDNVYSDLEKIYQPLLEKMEEMPIVKII